MTNVILPALYTIITLGRTIDLRHYNLNPYTSTTIFENPDVVETPVNVWNSTYYVVPDDNFQPSILGIPVDFIIRAKGGQEVWSMFPEELTRPLQTGVVSVAFVSRYITTERSIKETATPISGWQKSIPESDTHYVSSIQHGSEHFCIVTLYPTIVGDVQVVRRIVKDIMGSSGRVGADILDLWLKVMKTIKESKDLRGEVLLYSTTSMAINVDPPSQSEIEEVLKFLSDFPKYVIPDSPGNFDDRYPLFFTLKPLYELDKRYVPLEKNVLAERYLTKLNTIDNDLKRVEPYIGYFPGSADQDGVQKFDAFFNLIRGLQGEVRQLMSENITMYGDIDLSDFKSLFENYQKGLINTTENYLSAYYRLYEEQTRLCESDFQKPTSGALVVEENEVIKKGKVEGGLEKCKELCRNDTRCRTVGYSESDGDCVIYYRKTGSARIYIPKNGDMKLYERVCH